MIFIKAAKKELIEKRQREVDEKRKREEEERRKRAEEERRAQDKKREQLDKEFDDGILPPSPPPIAFLPCLPFPPFLFLFLSFSFQASPFCGVILKM